MEEKEINKEETEIKDAAQEEVNAEEAAVEGGSKETEGQEKEDVEEVLTKEAELEAKLAEANDRYIRLSAEFDNYRRRTAKERLELISTAGEDIIKGMLPVLDDCERALEVLKKSEDSDAAKEGTELIYTKLVTYLKTNGVEKIEAVGKDLDTDFHEAVAKFPVDEKKKKNKIIDVVQQGYTLRGKVIRFAKVVVGV